MHVTKFSGGVVHEGAPSQLTGWVLGCNGRTVHGDYVPTEAPLSCKLCVKQAGIVPPPVGELVSVVRPGDVIDGMLGRVVLSDKKEVAVKMCGAAPGVFDLGAVLKFSPADLKIEPSFVCAWCRNLYHADDAAAKSTDGSVCTGCWGHDLSERGEA